MNDTLNAYGAYQSARSHQSLTEQVIMLYDGVITFSRQAKDAINNKDWEARWNLLNRAISVINGLHEALDFAQGGEPGVALDRFYKDIDTRLVYVQCHNDIDVCDTIIRDMQIMRDAWKDIIRQETNTAASTTVSDTSGQSHHADIVASLKLNI